MSKIAGSSFRWHLPSPGGVMLVARGEGAHSAQGGALVHLQGTRCCLTRSLLPTELIYLAQVQRRRRGLAKGRSGTSAYGAA